MANMAVGPNPVLLAVHIPKLTSHTYSSWDVHQPILGYIRLRPIAIYLVYHIAYSLGLFSPSINHEPLLAIDTYHIVKVTSLHIITYITKY